VSPRQLVVSLFRLRSLSLCVNEKILRVMPLRISLYPCLRVAVCCSVLQCVAMCCSVLQRVGLCRNVLEPLCISLYPRLSCKLYADIYFLCCSVLQCVAVWCSVVQCGAVCCSVLQCDDQSQCVGVCWGVLACVAVRRCSTLA